MTVTEHALRRFRALQRIAKITGQSHDMILAEARERNAEIAGGLYGEDAVLHAMADCAESHGTTSFPAEDLIERGEPEPLF